MSKQAYPVSLTSIMCKMLEHIPHSQISKHLDKHKILTLLHHRFRIRDIHVRPTQLIHVVNDWMEDGPIDNFDQIDAAVLDLQIRHLTVGPIINALRQEPVFFIGLIGSTMLVQLLTWLHITDCFSYRNLFQNGINGLPKLSDHFLSKNQNCV